MDQKKRPNGVGMSIGLNEILPLKDSLTLSVLLSEAIKGTQTAKWYIPASVECKPHTN